MVGGTAEEEDQTGSVGKQGLFVRLIMICGIDLFAPPG